MCSRIYAFSPEDLPNLVKHPSPSEMARSPQVVACLAILANMDIQPELLNIHGGILDLLIISNPVELSVYSILPLDMGSFSRTRRLQVIGEYLNTCGLAALIGILRNVRFSTPGQTWIAVGGVVGGLFF